MLGIELEVTDQKRLGDADRVMDDVTPCMTANGVDPAAAPRARHQDLRAALLITPGEAAAAGAAAGSARRRRPRESTGP